VAELFAASTQRISGLIVANAVTLARGSHAASASSTRAAAAAVSLSAIAALGFASALAIT